MKLLAFSGLHGNRKLIDIFIDSIIAKNLDPDVFVCAGDIGDSIIVELFRKMLQFDKPILYVLGNHKLLDCIPKEAKKRKNFQTSSILKVKLCLLMVLSLLDRMLGRILLMTKDLMNVDMKTYRKNSVKYPVGNQY